VVVVVGTATEVGKTWVTARLMEHLRAGGTTGRCGITVSVRKPLQSYDPASSDPTDAEVLGAASGEHPEVVCAPDRNFPAAMAPPMAAEFLGRDIPTVADLVAELRWDNGIDLGIVETVGGVRSPLAADGDSRDLTHALGADAVVLVADAGLGVIDGVRKSTDALVPTEPLVFLNRYDPDDDLHRRNLEWLTDRDGFAVFVEIDALADRLMAEGDHDPGPDPTDSGTSASADA
jgi:dethiobiotin synthetase